MKAMLLSAGYGTRLGDLTREIPKPMLPLQERPLLEYLIRHLARHGFNQIMINLHFMPEMIQDYFADGQKLGVEITYVYEPELLGTAGGVKNAADYFQDEEVFLVHYGDILTNQDFTAMLDYHRASAGALATLLLHQRTWSNSRITLDKDNRIVKFLERPLEKQLVADSGAYWVNSGIYLVNKRVLDLIPPNASCDFPRHIFAPLAGKEKMMGFPLSGYRCAIDSPQRYFEAQTAVAEGKVNI